MAQYFTLIQSLNTNGGASASFSFTSIPSTYTDLCLEMVLNGTSSSPQTVLLLQWNDATSRQTQKLGASPPGTPSAGGNSNLSYFYTGNINAGLSPNYGFFNIYIPRYAETLSKSFVGISTGADSGTPIYMNWVSGNSSATTAINTLTITNEYGNWSQYCSANLYGITKA